MENVDTDEERQPLIESPQIKTSSRSLVLPFGIFLFTAARELGSTNIKQYVYNYTASIPDTPTNNSHTREHANNMTSTCDRNSSSPRNANQEVSANWLLYFELVEYSIGLPVIVLAGMYSDVYGRKPFLLLSSIGRGVEFLSLFFIVYFELDIVYCLLTYGISGLSGTHYTFYLVCSSLMADTTKTEKSRSFSIVLLHAYFGIGLSLASLGAGFLIQLTGFAMPMVVSSSACFFSAFVLSFQGETLVHNLRSDTLSLKKSFLRFFGFFYGKGYKESKRQKRWKFVITFLSFMFVLSPLTSFSSILTLTQLGPSLCFSSEMIGYFNAASSFAHNVFGAFVLKILHVCIHSETVTFIGLFSGISYFVIVCFSTTDWMIFMGAGVGLMCLIPMNLFRGFMSSMTSEKYQGSLFSLIYFFEAISRLTLNTAFLAIYGHTQDLMQGFVYLVMAGFYITAGVLFIPVAVSNAREQKQIESIQTLYVAGLNQENKEGTHCSLNNQ